MHQRLLTAALAAAFPVLVTASPVAPATQQTVNWETAHVSPIAFDAAGQRLFVCNTPDARLEVFDVSGAAPVRLFDVPVGLDPVSVRQHGANEVWVVNSISDSISIVDLARQMVVGTVQTDDEPSDVVFAGSPERAFVTCSQANLIQVFDPAAPGAPVAEVPILGEEPRALAVSADGSTVYAAIFESGNGSTVLGGGLDGSATLALPNVVSNPIGPYGGVNPPPNSGANFVPARRLGNPTEPAVGLIVKKDSAGNWMDDNGGDWTNLVSGPQAAQSGRPVGWDVSDHDVAVLDTATLGVTYADRLMNINMALAVHPISGSLTVVGTDAINEVRFEPNLNGVFLKVVMGIVDESTLSGAVVDTNPHLTYQTSTVPQATRDLSLGDPRGIAWTADGARGYVTGMGSNNVAIFNSAGARIGTPIEVGEGPTGIVLDGAGNRAFVVNKFDASISTISLGAGVETHRTSFYDPSPLALQEGRKHLYDTHENSGLGHMSCASCHVDARTDRLGWDLGDPSGVVESSSGQNLGMNLPGLNTGFQDFHPMKGPMLTQTFQDIIGKEPFHWRGDRDGLAGFLPAFEGLQGDDATPTGGDIDEFAAFLGTIHFPPNPFRNFDNSLPVDLPLKGHYSVGRFSPVGTQLPNGNAQNGLNRYTPPATLDGPFACVTCHTLPTGMGPDMRFNGSQYVNFPAGPDGEAHHGLVSVDGSTNKAIKIAQLRSSYKKVGMDLTQQSVLSGFGFLHDGSIASLSAFLSSPAFEFQGDQGLANMIAFMLAFGGSDLPNGNVNNPLFPPGTASQDTHAGVGTQVTIMDFATLDPATVALLAEMRSEADLGRVGLAARARIAGLPRGAAYVSGASFQMDRAADQMTFASLMALATPADPITLTTVPFGTQVRLGIDRDLDGAFDRDELDGGSDPANANSVPDLGQNYCGPAVINSSGNSGVMSAAGSRVATDNDLLLQASLLPSGSAGFFIASQGQGFVQGPGGSQGNLCISGNVARFSLQVQNSGAAGAFSTRIDLSHVPTNPPQGVLSGQTWNFQAWFRDSVGGQPTSNFTDGLSIDFE
ncbi:MAG: DNA-binding beta-propeller fold protein YncE [Planctomycetota bacterium]|jgi:DNA-binding beta-propeller fold protein YncE